MAKPAEPQPSKELLALRRATAFAVNLGSFLTPFMAASLNVGLPAMGRELRMSAGTVSWVASAFLLAAAVFTVPMGRIADIHGRRRVLLYGNVIFTVFSLLSAFAPSAAVMIAFRALQGLGGAMVFATGMAILTSVFPPGERGRVIGNTVTAVYMGLAVGPFAGGFLTQHFGWRSIFIVNFLLGVLLVVVMLWKLHGEWAEARGESFDLVGALVYGAMLIAWMLGLSKLDHIAGVGLLAAGVLGLVAFIVWELRSPSPVMQLSLFRSNPVFTLSSLAALIHYSATFAVTFVLSLYLQSARGFSAQDAGLILVAQPVMMALFSRTAGKLSDRFEPRLLASFGMSLTGVGVFLLSFVGMQTPRILLVANLLLLGFGFAFFSSPNANAIMSSLDRRHLGLGSGMLGTMRLLGQNFSMGIVMMLFGLYHLNARAIGPELQAQFVACLRAVFWVFSGLSLLGIFASLARGRMR
jgi:EmrB/QacA subfamily drug resistance transporter